MQLKFDKQHDVGNVMQHKQPQLAPDKLINANGPASIWYF